MYTPSSMQGKEGGGRERRGKGGRERKKERREGERREGERREGREGGGRGAVTRERPQITARCVWYAQILWTMQQ